LDCARAGITAAANSNTTTQTNTKACFMGSSILPRRPVTRSDAGCASYREALRWRCAPGAALRERAGQDAEVASGLMILRDCQLMLEQSCCCCENATGEDWDQRFETCPRLAFFFRTRRCARLPSQSHRRRCDCRCVELRALCDEVPRTPPGPEGSNGTGIASCAAEYPKFLSSPGRNFL
jgi:hypothetical protein